MKYKSGKFFNITSLCGKEPKAKMKTSATIEVTSIVIPHKVKTIELINYHNEIFSLLLIPSCQSSDVLNLCQSICQDSDLLEDDYDENENDRISPISIEAKEKFCVLVHTRDPDNFLQILTNAKAITDQEKNDILQCIRDHIKTNCYK